ncbi:MAG: hypothetical protein ABIA74_00575 [bacterium]
MKRVFIFFLISGMFFTNINCASDELIAVSNSNVVTIEDLELFKDLLIDEVKRQVDLLTEEKNLKTFNYIEKEKNDSSNLNSALNEVVSIKLLKILEEMSKEERESFLKQFIKGTWNHKYEIVIVTIVLIVVVGVIANSGDVVEFLSYEASKRLVENIAHVIEGIIKGGLEGSGNIIKNLWQKISAVIFQRD